MQKVGNRKTLKPRNRPTRTKEEKAKLERRVKLGFALALGACVLILLIAVVIAVITPSYEYVTTYRRLDGSTYTLTGRLTPPFSNPAERRCPASPDADELIGCLIDGIPQYLPPSR